MFRGRGPVQQPPAEEREQTPGEGQQETGGQTDTARGGTQTLQRKPQENVCKWSKWQTRSDCLKTSRYMYWSIRDIRGNIVEK